MRSIRLADNSELLFPEEWTELQPKHRLQAAEWLCTVLSGQMDPFEWQVRVLRMLTGYRPSRRYRNAGTRQVITDNLVRLAQQLTFAFSMDDTHTLALRYDMYDCPVHLGTRRAWQPHFTRDRVITTNLTARQYVDACDLLNMIQQPCQGDDRLWLMRKLTAVLWRTDDGMPLPNPTPGQLLLVKVWFTGVALFWQLHPVYSVLYESNNLSTDGRIHLGMSEILLELEQHGHHRAGDMLLTDFMDAQVKLLKDRLADARAHGVSTADLVRTTGLSLDAVTRL